MEREKIIQNVKRILSEIPQGVTLLAACKSRTAQEINAAIEGGIEVIGENYVQEALKVYPLIQKKVEWHFIGHVQRNKINKIIKIFDMIETLDDLKIAQEINKRCAKVGKVMPVLIEVNSAKESRKAGVFPEDVEDFIFEVSKFKNIKVSGLMTMGPLVKDPEDIRPFFRLTKSLFNSIKEKNIDNVEMKYLSMGMSDSYKIAIEEGANIIRIGTKIFGPRKAD